MWLYTLVDGHTLHCFFLYRTVLYFFFSCFFFFFFFFQAEDGIRDWSVTGVQTCALPILHVVFGAGPVTRAKPFQRRTIPDVGQGMLVNAGNVDFVGILLEDQVVTKRDRKSVV